MNFVSDNCYGATPEILAAIAALGQSPLAAYGDDDVTQSLTHHFCEVFERDVAVFPVVSGTAANALALATLVPAHGAILCHAEAHIAVDECGAPEFFTHGAKLVGIESGDAKLTPALIKRALAPFQKGVVHQLQPAAVSIAQASERGTVYSPAEIAAIAEVAGEHGMKVHMDGARFANALAGLGCSPAELTWKAGVDVLSFGATKNGALACEAVVFFDKRQAEAFPFLRKRGGHTLSKGRLLGAQMAAYLEDGLWLALAAHANAAARRLADGLAGLPGLRAAFPTEANEVFVIAPVPQIAAWRAGGAMFYEFPTRGVRPERGLQAGEAVVRLVTSFETSDAEIESFLALTHGG